MNNLKKLVEGIADSMKPEFSGKKGYRADYPAFLITYISYTDDANFFSRHEESVVDENAIERLKNTPWYCAADCEFEGIKYPQGEVWFDEFKEAVLASHEANMPKFKREEAERAAEYERKKKEAEDDYIGSREEKMRDIAWEERWHDRDDDEPEEEDEEPEDDE